MEKTKYNWKVYDDVKRTARILDLALVYYNTDDKCKRFSKAAKKAKDYYDTYCPGRDW